MRGSAPSLALVRAQRGRTSQASLWRKQQVTVRASWGKAEQLTLSIRQVQDRTWHIKATLGDLTIDQMVRRPLLEKLTARCFSVDWAPGFTLTLEQPINLAS